MSSKLVLIALTALLCTGVSQALECHLCSYQVESGQEKDMSTVACKTGEFTESSIKDQCEEGESCMVQYNKVDDDNYSWGRSCQPACNNTQTTTPNMMWIRCCDDEDLCNDQTEYGNDDGSESQDDDLEQCYSCTYTEENGEATSGSDVKCKNAVDDTISKVDCTTYCFVELMTMDNTTTLTRGCKEACENMEKQDDGDFRVCCNDKNLCNNQNEPETSGADVILRQSNIISAMIAVVMAMCAAWQQL